MTTSPNSGEYLHSSKVLLVRLYKSQAVQKALTKLQEGYATHTQTGMLLSGTSGGLSIAQESPSLVPGFDRNHRYELVDPLHYTTDGGHELSVQDTCAMAPGNASRMQALIYVFVALTTTCYIKGVPEEAFLLICTYRITHADIASFGQGAGTVSEGRCG